MSSHPERRSSRPRKEVKYDAPINKRREPGNKPHNTSTVTEDPGENINVAESSETINLPEKRRRKRPSSAFVAGGEDEAEPPAPTSRRRQKRPQRNADDEENAEEGLDIEEPSKVVEPPQKRRRKRPSSAFIAGGESQIEHPPTTSRKRQKRSQRDTDDDRDTFKKSRFQMDLIRRSVPKKTIEKSWTPLTDPSLSRISLILQNAERSISLPLKDSHKTTLARSAISFVSGKIQRKLARGLPFPPATRRLREDDFDVEGVLHSNRGLEGQVTSVGHSIQLLESQLKEEERLLAMEQAELEELEKNAKAEAGRAKGERRKMHPALQVCLEEKKNEGVRKEMKYSAKESKLGNIDEIDRYPELKPIVSQLENHVQSMTTNLAQIEGLEDAMRSGRAAIQDVLFRYVDTEKYHKAVLGE